MIVPVLGRFIRQFFQNCFPFRQVIWLICLLVFYLSLWLLQKWIYYYTLITCSSSLFTYTVKLWVIERVKIWYWYIQLWFHFGLINFPCIYLVWLVLLILATASHIKMIVTIVTEQLFLCTFVRLDSCLVFHSVDLL